MDILIDIIIYLIKQASKPRDLPIDAAAAEKAARARALQAERAAAVQKALAAQQSRAPVRGRKPAARPGPVSMPPTWSQPQPTAKWAATAPAVTKGAAAVVPADAPPRPARPGWQIPLLLGEILGPPAALREPEF